MPTRRSRRLLRITGALLAATAFVPSRCEALPGEITYSVGFVDPQNEFDALTRQRLTASVQAAGGQWDEVLVGEASIEVQVRATRSIPRGGGASVTSAFIGNDGVYNVFEWGMAHEVRTGVDTNGAEPDVEFIFNPDYVSNELWLDPDPFGQGAPVPANRTDATSVMLHEFGHAIAYNGWQDNDDGSLPGDFRAPWDGFLEFTGGDIFFTGANVVALNGGPAAVTSGNRGHWGNRPPRAGSELIPELMNGVVFERGTRYAITPLDRALLLDVGLSVVAPTTGDYDRNGEITTADFGVWERAYADPEVRLADGNGDGRIDAADYTVWRDAAPDGVLRVPTPAGATLLAAALLLFASRSPR